MLDIQLAKEELLNTVNEYQKKKDRADQIGPDYYEPGEMEYLDQYLSVYDESRNMISIQTEAKGLRYEDRTPRLDFLAVGDPLEIVREPDNPFNENNFMILSEKEESLGNLPAELCNVLAPLVDLGYAEIRNPHVCFVERIRDRSRYAKQGVLFVSMEVYLFSM